MLMFAFLFLTGHSQLLTADAQTCPQFIYDLNHRATVKLEVSGSIEAGVPKTSYGTGFVVSESGYLITAYHVVQPSPAFRRISITATIFGKSSQPIPVEVNKNDEDDDLVLLKLPDDPDFYPPVVLGTNSSSGATVCSGGFPQLRAYSPTSGTLGSDYEKWLTASMPTNEGESGSPVFLPDGEVVAVRKGKFALGENSSVLIPIRYAHELLSRVPDLNASCTLLAGTPQQPITAPYPHLVQVTLDNIKLGHLTQDLKVACGQRHRTFSVSVNWDRSSRRLPPQVTTCDVSGSMEPGNAYYVAEVLGLEDDTGLVILNSCSFLEQNSFPH
jgi:hypothetical protein